MFKPLQSRKGATSIEWGLIFGALIMLVIGGAVIWRLWNYFEPPTPVNTDNTTGSEDAANYDQGY